MKWYLHPISVTFFVMAFIVTLPLLLSHKRVTPLTDKALIKSALSRNIIPIPTTLKALQLFYHDKNLTSEKIALGKALFFEKLLSKDKTISCSSCHKLKEGGDDNLPTAIGYHQLKNPSHLNTPTVLNVALATSFFWDGRASSLKEQAKGPIQAPFEMNMPISEIEKRINNTIKYKKAFHTLYHKTYISFEDIVKSIALYEKTLLTRSTFDTFLEGNISAINQQAKRGFHLFLTAGCSGCHSGIALGGQSVQKFPLRNYLFDYIGLNSLSSFKNSPFPFKNKGNFLGRGNQLKFRVPLLRNITKTAPYFHNGSVKKLEEVIKIMGKYQVGIDFNTTQIDDIMEFFKTLEGKLIK